MPLFRIRDFGMAVAALAVFSCTSPRMIRIPDGKEWSHVEDRMRVVLFDGDVVRCDSIQVLNDTAFCAGKIVAIKEIRQIEIRSLSVPKTIGLAAGTAYVAALLLGVGMYLAVVLGRNHP